MSKLFYRDGTEFDPNEPHLRVLEPVTEKGGLVERRFRCLRCSGQGGWKGWPGFTCYRCGGRNSHIFEAHEARLYTADKINKLDASREKARAAKIERERAAVIARRDTWTASHPEYAELLSRLDNDFGRSLQGAIEKYGYLTERQAACLGDAVERHEARKRRDAEKAAAPPSQHWGNVGDKFVNVPFLVEAIIEIAGTYGTTSLVKMVREGSADVTVWFASSLPCAEDVLENDMRAYRPLIVKGERVVLRGTIKDHNTREGVAQTVVTRCKAVA